MTTLLARLTAVPPPIRLLCVLGLVGLLLLSVFGRHPGEVTIPLACPMPGGWATPNLAWQLRELASAVLPLAGRLLGRCWSARKVALA
ncbi:MAG: hypothetical protein ACJ8F7_14390 [Gemmataceae bacterium]